MNNKKSLTKRQQQILDFILAEIHKKGYPPSVRDIGKAVGLSSTSTVHSHLSSLEKKGYLRRDPAKPRAIEVLGFREAEIGLPPSKIRSVPVVGRIAAGTPLLAEENIEDTFPLPADMVKDNAFILKTKGDSMVGAGIFENDYLVVRQQSTAQNGDIVVALLGEEATVKRFYKEKDRIRLQPENPAMEPIFSQDVIILGKVTALLRLL
ncbi:transcriptional repressor LexA [Candidatus Oleimmundimicrobium sp.]|uniref:transcriptional repressor LexA n=1 Tax=Candidatus Oleimmundimicrobium sp. TaxID=3060597 RepID=UPI0027236C1F|nr:transcriptional repressor LexA [Candidatus Oleimmundimicrobium sp.]MDO8885403.1 transcriptional repressor LexA [Candidatus Oleimmundimicrobium sp.]